MDSQLEGERKDKEIRKRKVEKQKNKKLEEKETVEKVLIKQTMPLKKLIVLLTSSLFLTISCTIKEEQVETNYKTKVIEVLNESTLKTAKENLNKTPVTITTFSCERSTGGINDFYSEGDYWWPDSLNPSGPYIRKDGMTNPENFTKHREAVMRLSELVGSLTSAYIITENEAYAKEVIKHCKAWFINEETKMNPHFLYAQAIQGRHTGRGIGIIDGIHFMEVVQSLDVLEKAGLINEADQVGFKAWFSTFTDWLTTHPYAKKEMIHPNNHGTCWNMQVGLYADYVGNDSIVNFCRENYKNTLLPNQMGIDGSFPLELDRTKPYGYSLFNLDAMAMNCVILSDEDQNLWEYSTSDGKSMAKALEFMAPYIKDKSTWFKEPDVMYWNDWPVAHSSLLFGAIVFDKPSYYELWKENEHHPEVFEVKRNLPVRNPLIWMGRL